MPPQSSDEGVARVRAAIAAAEAASKQRKSTEPYDHPRLVALVLAHAQAVGAEAEFAAAFLQRMGTASDNDEAALAAVDVFADELVIDLLLPLRAIASCSPVPEPAPGTTIAGQADWPHVYIVPPSPMMSKDEDGDLNDSGRRAAELLAVIDPTALALLGYAAISTAGTHNCVALPPAASSRFARFEAWLQPVGDAERYYLVLDNEITPVTTTASSHLLAFHAAVATMLHASGAGRFVDDILAETGAEDLDTDGQTHLELLLRLRLDGWWDGGRRRRVGRDNGSAGDDDDDGIWIEQGVFVEEVVSR